MQWAKHPPQLAGFDWGWLASDADGRVGLFFTAGEGPVPAALCLHDETLEMTESLALGLPVIGKAIFERFYPDLSSFESLAVRGVFVFDWADVHRNSGERTAAYQLIARPDPLVWARGLPDELSRKTKLAQFEHPFGQSVGTDS